VVILLQGDESSIDRLPDNFRSIAKSWLIFVEEYKEQQQNNIEGGAISSNLPTLEELCNCNSSTADMIRKMSRIEQLHLNVLYTFIFNRGKYDEIARNVCISKLY